MMDDPGVDTEDGKDRNFVTALARGLEVLRCFKMGETALTNTDFSERTGLPKATITRLTHTLCALEYLIADSRAGTYRLGAGVLQLGFGVLGGMDIAERAKPQMRALRNGPNSYITVAMGERHKDDVVYMAVQPSREDVALSMRIGSRLPLFHSAIGRAILVGMDDDERAEAFDVAQRIAPQNAPAHRAAFDKAQQEYQTLGYCTGYGEWRPDVNGIAVPVRSLDGARVFGLNVGGPSFHVKKRQLETVYAKLLTQAAQNLSSSI